MTDTTVTAAPLDPLTAAKAGMRLIRNPALAATDFMVLPDAKLPAGVTAAQVTAYRQYLRDLPNTAVDNDFMTFKGITSLTDWIAAQPK
jgi:hypothetical protein